MLTSNTSPQAFGIIGLLQTTGGMLDPAFQPAVAGNWGVSLAHQATDSFAAFLDAIEINRLVNNSVGEPRIPDALQGVDSPDRGMTTDMTLTGNPDKEVARPQFRQQLVGDIADLLRVPFADLSAKGKREPTRINPERTNGEHIIDGDLDALDFDSGGHLSSQAEVSTHSPERTEVATIGSAAAIVPYTPSDRESDDNASDTIVSGALPKKRDAVGYRSGEPSPGADVPHANLESSIDGKSPVPARSLVALSRLRATEPAMAPAVEPLARDASYVGFLTPGSSSETVQPHPAQPLPSDLRPKQQSIDLPSVEPLTAGTPQGESTTPQPVAATVAPQRKQPFLPELRPIEVGRDMLAVEPIDALHGNSTTLQSRAERIDDHRVQLPMESDPSSRVAGRIPGFVGTSLNPADNWRPLPSTEIVHRPAHRQPATGYRSVDVRVDTADVRIDTADVRVDTADVRVDTAALTASTPDSRHVSPLLPSDFRPLHDNGLTQDYVSVLMGRTENVATAVAAGNRRLPVSSVVAVSESQQPIVAVSESQQPIVAVSDSQQPIVAVSESQQPVAATSESGQSIVAFSKSLQLTAGVVQSTTDSPPESKDGNVSSGLTSLFSSPSPSPTGSRVPVWQAKLTPSRTLHSIPQKVGAAVLDDLWQVPKETLTKTMLQRSTEPAAVAGQGFDTNHVETQVDARSLRGGTDTREIWRAVPAQVHRAIRTVDRVGVGESIEIELDPPELGRVVIKLETDGRRITARMLVDHQSVATILGRGLMSLVHSLEAVDLTVDDIFVGLQNEHAGQGDNRQRSPFSGASAQWKSSPALSEVDEPTQSDRATFRAVDIVI